MDDNRREKFRPLNWFGATSRKRKNDRNECFLFCVSTWASKKKRFVLLQINCCSYYGKLVGKRWPIHRAQSMASIHDFQLSAIAINPFRPFAHAQNGRQQRRDDAEQTETRLRPFFVARWLATLRVSHTGKVEVKVMSNAVITTCRKPFGEGERTAHSNGEKSCMQKIRAATKEN